MDPFLFSFEWGDRKCLLKYRFEFSRKFGSQMLKVEASSSRRKDFPSNIPPFNVFNFSRRRSQEHGRILSPTEIYEKRFKIFFFYRFYTTQISMQTKAKKGSWETLISSIAMIIFLYAQVESDNATKVESYRTSSRPSTLSPTTNFKISHTTFRTFSMNPTLIQNTIQPLLIYVHHKYTNIYTCTYMFAFLLEKNVLRVYAKRDNTIQVAMLQIDLIGLMRAYINRVSFN